MEGYAIAATKNQEFEAILFMMLRSLQARYRAFFIINLPSRGSYWFSQTFSPLLAPQDYPIPGTSPNSDRSYVGCPIQQTR
ncbi:MAG: hypothetical protein QNJ41_12015 [Xenococcaceae cyanobacterium MO_188.B32]|nr:hypothetical protein [Xenococcaceae cyanobacterium MO_188.B32]